MNISEADRILKDMLRSGNREKIAEAYDFYQASENKMLAMACAGSLQIAESLHLSEEEWRVSRILVESKAVLTPEGFSVAGGLVIGNIKGPLSIPVCQAGRIFAWESTDITFPKLTSFRGSLDADNSTNLCFPALELAHGDINAKGSVGLNFQELRIFEGNFFLWKSQGFLASKLVQIHGSVIAEESMGARFPELEEISETLNWRKSSGFRAPKLLKARQVIPGRNNRAATPMLRRQNVGHQDWSAMSLEYE